MVEQFLAIVRNTFFESIRQPVMLVVLVAATLLIFLSVPLSAFTLEDDQRMYVDIGLSTIFICGTILSAMVATNVLTREIENKTVLTVISKPVTRPVFFLGKYAGVALALTLATVYMGLVFMLIELHGTMPTVTTPYHIPVIVFGLSAAAIAVGVGVWCNFFYGRVFASTVICVLTPLVALAYLLSLLFKPNFEPRPIQTAFQVDLWLAIGGLALAILMLTAIAVAVSTRLNQVLTLFFTLGVFLIGLLSDWLFGRPIKAYEDRLARLAESGQAVATSAGDQLTYALCKAAYALVPNYQVLWLSDAITQKQPIPMDYMAQTTVYGLLFIVAALAAGVILFQRREVG
jgi:ABC-2 type transport system permease protein